MEKDICDQIVLDPDGPSAIVNQSILVTLLVLGNHVEMEIEYFRTGIRKSYKGNPVTVSADLVCELGLIDAVKVLTGLEIPIESGLWALNHSREAGIALARSRKWIASD